MTTAQADIYGCTLNMGDPGGGGAPPWFAVGGGCVHGVFDFNDIRKLHQLWVVMNIINCIASGTNSCPGLRKVNALGEEHL